jgi:hypothetical protein
MVKNEEGLVAVRHWNSNPSAELVNETMYHFTPQHGASIGWVKEEDVAYLLTLKAKLCCNASRAKYFLPDEQQVRVWKTGRL